MQSSLPTELPSGVAIQLSAVSKVFRAKRRLNRADSRERLSIMLQLIGLAGQGDDMIGRQNDDAVTALDNVTIAFNQGMVWGLSGASGGGRSTLLRLIAGVIPPTSGQVLIRGTTAKLLDDGDIDEQLSVAEFLSNEQRSQQSSGIALAKDAEAALNFAELSEFADVPIKKLSTGMRLRAAIASVLCGDASVVLIDDYSAVGDIGFQQRCRQRIRTVAKSGRTVLLSSNDTTLLQTVCDRVVWMEEGQIVTTGEASHVLSEMQTASGRRKHLTELTCNQEVIRCSAFQLTEASVSHALTTGNRHFKCSDPLQVWLIIDAYLSISRLDIGITLFNDGKQVLRSVLRDPVGVNKGERLKVGLVLPAHTLAPGAHDLEVVIEPDASCGLSAGIKRKRHIRFVVDDETASCATPPCFWKAQDHVITCPKLRWTCQLVSTQNE